MWCVQVFYVLSYMGNCREQVNKPRSWLSGEINECVKEGNDHCAWSASYGPVRTAQDTAFIALRACCWLCRLISHCLRCCYLPVRSHPLQCRGLLSQVQDLHLSLVNVRRFLLTRLPSLSPSEWQPVTHNTCTICFPPPLFHSDLSKTSK